MFRETTLNVLQQQYGYTNISDLMTRKAAVWDKYMGDIAARFVSEILNYNTCVSSALDYYWGKILKISRTFTDENGNEFSLTDDQFREVIKLRAFGTTWDGTAETMNKFLAGLFGERGGAFIVDRQDMTVQVYTFRFYLEDWERYLFTTQDILPRCAAIETNIYEISKDDLIGFEGTDYQSLPLYEDGEPNQNTVFWGGQTL